MDLLPSMSGRPGAAPEAPCWQRAGPRAQQQPGTAGRRCWVGASSGGGARQHRRGARSARCRGFFKNPFRQSSEDAGTYGSQGRGDYSEDDVEHYFNYMGLLAVEGTYDSLNAMLKQGLEPVDLLLLMAAKENDAPKVQELLQAGADPSVKGREGKTAPELATKEETLALFQGAPAAA